MNFFSEKQWIQVFRNMSRQNRETSWVCASVFPLHSVLYYPYGLQPRAKIYNLIQGCTTSYKVGGTTLYNLVQSRTTSYKVVQPHTRLYNLEVVPTSTMLYNLVQGCTTLYEVVQQCALKVVWVDGGWFFN